ncbi:MAG TPA: pyridoxal phosphate-dependent aminotransferase [Candidatus Acidoferrales bacterium]|jgi:aspartate aminotransferase|nr:pyridoxal phosphate-dependent aminotransferase [Candidatus Acidoferrales bacterium]
MEPATGMKMEEIIELADRVNRISVSQTMMVLQEAERYKARGVDVADFGPGEPDFPTPEHIKRAAIKALEENRTKYTATPGIAPLRQAICDWHSAKLGSSYQPAECIVTSGGKHAIFNAACALLNSGDEVIIPAPYWVSYPDIVKVADATPVFLPTRAEDGFRLRAADLEKSLTPKTKLVIANSPSNPTGAVIPPDEFARILAVCKRHGTWLLTDECYSHFTYGDAKPYSVASLPGSKDRLIVAGSLSKTFAMTGWRIGYALAPKPLVDAMTKLQSQSTSNPNSITQYAGLEALRGPMDSVTTMLAEYARRRERILAGLRAIPGVTCTTPEGAFYVFPNVSAHLDSTAPDTTAMARELLEREHVAVVPGDAFGAPGHLRISYATSMERIEEGLRRLTRFFGRAA